MANKQKELLFLGLGVAVLYAALKGGEKIKEAVTTTDTTNLPHAYRPSEFIKKFYPINQEIFGRTGLPAVFSLAQAGAESLWGNKAPGNNLFGIKADKSWQGDVQLRPTWECGKTGDPKTDRIFDQVIAIYPPGDPQGACSKAGLYSYRVYGKFRKYATIEDSFNDHATFLRSMPRYSKAFNTTEPKLFAQMVADAGYSSNPASYKILMNGMIDSVNKALGIS